MYESKWVRFVYAFALVWVMLTWASTSFEMVSALISPKHKTYGPTLVASVLLTTAVILPFCLQRLVVVQRGPGIRRLIVPAVMARSARFLGLGVIAVCVMGAALLAAGAMLAAGLQGGGAILLFMAYLKPYSSIVSPLAGILLFEGSRLLAYESLHTGAP